jgi:hypothetical protein
LLVGRPYSTERFPRWSPNGRWLAYVSFANSIGFGRGNLRIIELGTGEDRELLRNVGLPVSWSPDSEWLLVYNTKIEGLEVPGLPTALPPQPSEAQRFGLYVYRLEDGALFRLRGPAGGAAARAGSFKWGQWADWTAGTPTPETSPSPTNTAPASPTPTPSPRSSPTSTPSLEPTPTALVSRVHLPLLSAGVDDVP